MLLKPQRLSRRGKPKTYSKTAATHFVLRQRTHTKTYGIAKIIFRRGPSPSLAEMTYPSSIKIVVLWRARRAVADSTPRPRFHAGLSPEKIIDRDLLRPESSNSISMTSMTPTHSMFCRTSLVP